MKKYFLALAAFAASTVVAFAQSGTNSPYSQYGLGKLADQSIGMSRGMNGVGLALRENSHINYLNPASYSGVDSLTFVFDIGMSLQNTNFKENGVSKNAKNGDFEYAVGMFRATKHVGVAFGILPYTNVGYSYSASQKLNGYVQAPSDQATSTATSTYSGSGGLHQIFLGAGWEPVKNFSFGANLSYLYGTCTNNVAISFSDSYIKSLTKTYTNSVKALKVDLGASYTFNLDKKKELTVAATYTPGYKLGASSDCNIISSNAQSSVVDTTDYVASNACAIPTQLGIGASLKMNKKWLLAFDYTLQKWSSIDDVDYVSDKGVKVGSTGSYSDRHEINFGGQYCKNEQGRTFLERVRYRFGAGYTSSYLKINNADGPKEVSVSAGFGIPIVNAYNNRSIVNVSLQWSRLSAKNLITENTFLINIGITFNERWFAKWKFE